MKVLGLLGGMSWESTVPYYRIINQEVNRRLGGLHSARIVLHSVDFAEIERLQHEDDWGQAARILIGAARGLERAGAEGLVICTNTMHRIYDEIDEAFRIPVLHIADATAEAILEAGRSAPSGEIKSVGLLGTRFTMEADFYHDRLRELHDIDVLTPGQDDRELVHRVIYEELCLGVVQNDSRAEFVRIIDGLVSRGAQGIILGCTEISMLVRPDDVTVPAFDTMEIHALKAADWALHA